MNVERRSPNMLGSWRERGKSSWNRLLPRERGFLEKILAFRINSPGYQNVKQPVLFRHDLALQDITLQVALVSPETGNVCNPRFMCLLTLLLSRLTAYFASFSFSTGAFTPALVLSLKSSLPQTCSHHFSSPTNMCRISLFITFLSRVLDTRYSL